MEGASPALESVMEATAGDTDKAENDADCRANGKSKPNEENDVKSASSDKDSRPQSPLSARTSHSSDSAEDDTFAIHVVTENKKQGLSISTTLGRYSNDENDSNSPTRASPSNVGVLPSSRPHHSSDRFLSNVSSSSNLSTGTPDWRTKFDTSFNKSVADNPVLGANAGRRRCSFDMGDMQKLAAEVQAMSPRASAITDAKILAHRRKKGVDATDPAPSLPTASLQDHQRLVSLVVGLDSKMSQLLEASKQHDILLRACTIPHVPTSPPAAPNPASSSTSPRLSRQRTLDRKESGSQKWGTHDSLPLPGGVNMQLAEASRESSPIRSTVSSSDSHSNIRSMIEDRFDVKGEASPSRENSSPKRFSLKRENSFSSVNSPPKRSAGRTSTGKSQASQNSMTSSASDFSGNGNFRVQSSVLQTVSTLVNRNSTLQKIWTVLEEPELVAYGSQIAMAMDCLVLSSVCFTFLQLLLLWPSSSAVPKVIELALDLLFSMEITARFISCPNRSRFFTNLFNLVDIAASLPALTLHSVDLVLFLLTDHQDDKTLEDILLCVVPVLRSLKLLRRFQKIHLLFKAFSHAFEALPVLLFVLSIIILLFSSMLYLLEPRENIPSFGMAVYLTTVTLTTVGYGDVTPESPGGQIIMCILGVASGLYMSLPFGIVGGAFKVVWEDRDRLILLRRIRKVLLDMNLSACDIPSLFRCFDEDKDGHLSLIEFRKMVRSMNINMTDRRVGNLFLMLDLNGNGRIDDEEFTRSLFPGTDFSSIYGSESEEQGQEG